MKKFLLALPFVAALAAVIAFGSTHLAVAQEPPLTPTWPQTATFTDATPPPMVVNIAGYNYCTFTAETGATFDSTVLSFKASADSGTTYETISGTTDPGATPAPASSLSAVGKVTMHVAGHNLFKVTAASGTTGASIVGALYCVH